MTLHSKLNLERITEQRNELRDCKMPTTSSQPSMIRIARHGLVKPALRSPKWRWWH